MLALGNDVDEARDVQRIGAQRPGRDLAMNDERGDVGMIRGDLAPPLETFIGGYPQETHELVAECLDGGDLHALRSDPLIRS